MTEDRLYNRIINGARRDGVCLFRLTDGGGRQPFDLAGMAWGKAVGVEVKVDDRPHGVDWSAPMPAKWFNDRRVHQLHWLKAYAEEGAYALLVIHEKRSGDNYLLRVPPGIPSLAACPMAWIACGLFVGQFAGWRGFLRRSDQQLAAGLDAAQGSVGGTGGNEEVPSLP